MKQLLQNLKTGELEVAELPAPAVQAGHLLIATHRNLISSGTERTIVEFAGSSLVDKARKNPDRVRQVIEKVRTDGLRSTYQAVKTRLDKAVPLGYCNAGHVLEIGPGVTGYRVGQRVASNGPHAGVVNVPVNLCAPVPDAVDDEAAAFMVLGAIALQGVRLAQPTLGEQFCVMGLGLVGLLAVQFLRAQGCRVLASDFDPARLALAAEFGAEIVDLTAGADPVEAARSFTRERGIDGVLIATATESDDPIHQAALMCRKRGRIILIGVTGLQLARADFYEKELSFQVSCSYGPGRYDPAYEEQGRDYPAGYVRWTEQRNFEAVLEMMADDRLNVTSLVSHRFPLDRAPEAYRLLISKAPSLGIVLEHDHSELRPSGSIGRMVRHATATRPRAATSPVVGVIGAGSYATATLLPALAKTPARLKTVMARKAANAGAAARRFGFEQSATDVDLILDDPEINTVLISTRHDSHAELVRRALAAGKNTFVEKPLAISREQLHEIMERYDEVSGRKPAPCLMVGFNRRFAPHIIKLKSLLVPIDGPMSMIMTVNAGVLPSDHWTLDLEAGGGRIIGEACHFVDLLCFLSGAAVTSVQSIALTGGARDETSILLGFADGSVGTIHYLTSGHRAVPKERLELFKAGRVIQLDNFRRMRGYGWPGFRSMALRGQDKGHTACVAAFVDAVARGEASPIPFADLVASTALTFDATEAASG
jgi:predicted dehydrogenase/threonine dehydrogenase-like Zn-dependent dehydrogenase